MIFKSSIGEKIICVYLYNSLAGEKVVEEEEEEEEEDKCAQVVLRNGKFSFCL